MKRQLIGFLLSILLTACGSDNLQLTTDENQDMIPGSVICCQASMGVNNSNSNGGTIQNGRGNKVSSYYPSDHIYLIANVRGYINEYKKLFDRVENSTNGLDDDIEDKLYKKYVLEIPVLESGNQRYIELCFSQPNPNSNNWAESQTLFAMSDDKKVKLKLNEECIFSSTASGIAILEKEYKTSGGKVVFEPYEDELFFSKMFQVGKSGGNFTMNFQSGGGQQVIDGKNQFSITLDRATAFLQSGLVITNMDKAALTKSEFEDSLGNIDHWEFREIIGQTSNAYTVRNQINAGKPKQESYISLFDWESFKDIQHTDKATSKTYQGFGYKNDDDEGAFIFEVPDWKANLYYNFKYEWEKEDKKRTAYATLHVKMEGLGEGIQPNSNWQVITVIDYLDLKKAILKASDKQQRTRLSYDDTFGPIIDIPYKFIIKKN